jgi:hypothetical protein
MKFNKHLFFGVLFACIAAAPLFTASSAQATANCAWVKQQDGSNWGTCVGDDGKMFCVSCAAGKDATPACPTVPCK